MSGCTPKAPPLLVCPNEGFSRPWACGPGRPMILVFRCAGVGRLAGSDGGIGCCGWDYARFGTAARVFPTHGKPIKPLSAPRRRIPRARLNLIVESSGTLDLDYGFSISSADLDAPPGRLARGIWCKFLADLKPGFMALSRRYVLCEGSHLDRRYQWKSTIGPVEERKLLVNRWELRILSTVQLRITINPLAWAFLSFFKYAKISVRNRCPFLIVAWPANSTRANSFLWTL